MLMPLDKCLAREGGTEEGWEEHIRFDVVKSVLERRFRAWKSSGASVEVSAELTYNDEKAWVEKKRNAQALLDLTE